MTDVNFMPICDKLEQIHAKYPTLRFTEIIQNAIDRNKKISNVNLVDVSSKLLLTALNEYESFLDVNRTG